MDDLDTIIDPSLVSDEDILITPAEPEFYSNNIESMQHEDVVLKIELPLQPINGSTNYNVPFYWGNGYEHWNLVRFATPMDGSCLFHAIANSFFEPYHSQKINGKEVPRIKLIQTFRKELSQKLSDKDPNSPTGKTFYEELCNGSTSTFAKEVPEFSIKIMQANLDSKVYIGYGYMEFIGNAIGKDIYILDATRFDIYVTDELRFMIKGNRPSIVLFYTNNHYELVGVKNNDGKIDTYFNSTHSFIMFLKSRVQELINK